jgi:solute carrier family 25 citrate transporter 1
VIDIKLFNPSSVRKDSRNSPMVDSKKSKNPLLPLAAGCIAGGIEATCVWPMEYIKTQLQLHAKGSKLPYSGMISGLTYTVKTSGEYL